VLATIPESAKSNMAECLWIQVYMSNSANAELIINYWTQTWNYNGPFPLHVHEPLNRLLINPAYPATVEVVYRRKVPGKE